MIDTEKLADIINDLMSEIEAEEDAVTKKEMLNELQSLATVHTNIVKEENAETERVQTEIIEKKKSTREWILGIGGIVVPVLLAIGTFAARKYYLQAAIVADSTGKWPSGPVGKVCNDILGTKLK